MTNRTHEAHRQPYVGEGEDGARRSAQVDREEADRLDYFDERREQLLVSAERWDRQAYELMLERLGSRRPTFAQLRAGVGSEDWLAALALLDLSPAVARDAEQYTQWSEYGGRYTDDSFQPNAEMDWEAWVADVDEHGRGWSSTEWRLFELVAALVIAERKLALRGTLDAMGSWERQVLDVIVQWASGGNNRDLPGRVRVEGPRSEHAASKVRQ